MCSADNARKQRLSTQPICDNLQPQQTEGQAASSHHFPRDARSVALCHRDGPPRENASGTAKTGFETHLYLGSAGRGLRRQDECHHVSHPAKRETDFGVVVATTGITKDNGAIEVTLGSNQWNDVRDSTSKDEYLIELRKGDAEFYPGSVYYGVAPNNTGDPPFPWDVARNYPVEVRRLLGYYVSRPYGGAVEHMEPLDYLAVKDNWPKYIRVGLV